MATSELSWLEEELRSGEELSEDAQAILGAITMMYGSEEEARKAILGEKHVMVDELCRLLKKIEGIPCVRPEEEEKGIFYDLRRVEAIDEEIRDSGSAYKWIEGKNYYRLYGQADLETLRKEFSKIVLVSSHADNLQEKSNYYMTPDKKYINGCFDNAGTNAVCTYLMKYEYEELPRNVLFAFTADEEHDSESADHVSKKLREYFGEGNVNVVVLDVTTYPSWDFEKREDFFYVNDYIFEEHGGKDFIKGICYIARKSNYLWRRDAQNINLKDCYIANEFNTFTLDLPCLAKDMSQMHSNDGFLISLQTICNYTDFLCQFLQKRQEQVDEDDSAVFWGEIVMGQIIRDAEVENDKLSEIEYVPEEDAEDDYEPIVIDGSGQITYINIYKASEGGLYVAETIGEYWNEYNVVFTQASFQGNTVEFQHSGVYLGLDENLRKFFRDMPKDVLESTLAENAERVRDVLESVLVENAERIKEYGLEECMVENVEYAFKTFYAKKTSENTPGDPTPTLLLVPEGTLLLVR